MKAKRFLLLLFLFILFICLNFLGNQKLKQDLINSERVQLIETSSNGSYIDPEWIEFWGNDKQDEGNCIEIDSYGNIYVAGFTNSSSITKEDILLIKYNSAGEEQWNFTWGGNGEDVCNAIAIDSTDNIYLAGSTNSYGAGNFDQLLVKVNSSGALKWYRTFGGSGNDYCNAIVIDSLGILWLGGCRTNTDIDLTIIKYDPLSDQADWMGAGIGFRDDYAIDIAIDSSNKIWVVGYNEQSDEILLERYGRQGSFEKFFHWGIYNEGMPTSLTIDSSDDMFIGGDFYNGPVKNLDFFLIKVNSTGYFHWSHEWGDTGLDRSYGVTLDSNENVYISGSTSSLGQGLEDVCIAKYSNKEGVQLYNATWGGTSNESALALKCDSFDNIYIAGFTYSYGAGSSDLLLLKCLPFFEIKVTNPRNNQFFGLTAPTFQIEIDPQFNDRLYTVNDGIPHNFSGTSGNINQSDWNLSEDGPVIIRFYANNSLGDKISGAVSVIKDTIIPQITINSPETNQLFGIPTLDFALNIIEINLNTTWYTLNDGFNYEFLGTEGTIDQNAWDLCDNGTVSIKFYVNDSVGHTTFEEVVVRKDTSSPNITIISPSQYQLYGEDTFSFNISITSSSIDKRWYSLNGGLIYFFTGLNGTINHNAWNICGNGSISIRFYANNSLGNIAFKEVIVYKDILGPNISILLPTENQVFGELPFIFDLNIIEGNLESTWYSLNDGLTNYTFEGKTGTIEQNAWDDKDDGIIYLRFYANDSISNLGYTETTIIKDTTPPYIMVNIPKQNALFGNTAFDFNLTIHEPYLQSTWYTLDSGFNNYTFSGTSGVISQSVWDDCANGTILLRFYTSDSVGHVSFDEVIIRKDNISPEISILSPIENTLFGDNTFNFNLSIYEPHLNSTWYTFDGGVNNYFFSGLNGTVDQEAWDNCNDGEVYLRFYANDSLGNTAFAEVIIYKSFDLHPRNAYAIVIGIENYPGTVNDLSYCVDDAISIYSYLRFGCNFKEENIILLLNSGATYSAIGSALQQIRSKIKARDIFFFYYSGHGGTDGGSGQFICPYDSLPSTPSNFYYDWMIDLELNFISSIEKYIIIDSCNSGGMIPEAQASGRYFMTACRDYELSWETPELRHGVFTNFFLDSSQYATDLNGDGVLSLEEQYSYTYSHVVSYMSGLGESVHPVQNDGISGPTVLYPSIGDLSLIPFLNQIYYSFYLYGHGSLRTLNLTIYSISPNLQIKTIDLTFWTPSNTGFGAYSGQVQLDNGYNLTGYELLIQIEGYTLKTFQFTFDEDTDGDGLFDILEIKTGTNLFLNDTDEDGISDYNEYFGLTNPLLNDTDSDGIPDGFEVFNGLNPIYNDSLLDLDNDGLNNIAEFYLGTLVNDADTDNDGIEDGYEYFNGLDLFNDDANLDYDNDTLTNFIEFQIGSIANNSDSDGDTMPDGWEYNNNLNLMLNDTNLDYDNDTLTNLLEFQIGSIANNSDSDGDGMPDGWEYDNDLNLLVNDANLDLDGDELTNLLEYQCGSDVNNSDTDGDTMPDGWEYDNDLNLLVNDANLDNDSDGLTNLIEYELGSLANNIDTEGDGMPDGWEHENTLDLLTDDANLDPDNDGLENIEEYENNTDPNEEDTDGDTWNDGDELERGTDPLDPYDFPRAPSQAVPSYPLIPLIFGILVLTGISIKKIKVKDSNKISKSKEYL